MASAVAVPGFPNQDCDPDPQNSHAGPPVIHEANIGGFISLSNTAAT